VLVRHTLSQKLGIGFRHATVPKATLIKWSKWIAKAIVRRSELPLGNIHYTSVFTIMGILTLDRQYVLDKTIHLAEGLTKDDDMTHTHRMLVDRANSDDQDKATTETTKTLQELNSHGIHIEHNPHVRETEKVSKSKAGSNTATYQGAKIPIRMGNYDLWGKGFTTTPGTMARICTDGSTNPRAKEERSGAGLTYAQDEFEMDEYRALSEQWRISIHDNYCAELSAINRALRAVPVAVDLTIYTDSQSSIDSIKRYSTRGTDPGIECEGRPYIRSILRALRARDREGTVTHILHVKSHTGHRDAPSIGNEAADRAATGGRLRGDESDIDKLHNELKYIVLLQKPPEDPDLDEKWEPIHGNVRKSIKKQLMQQQLAQWGERPTRGRLARTHQTHVVNIIKQIWKAPTTSKITFLIDILNQADPTDYGQHQRSKWICKMCKGEHELTIRHRLLDCRATADLWNRADREIWELIGGSVKKTAHNTLTKEVETKVADLGTATGWGANIKIPNPGGGTINISRTQAKAIARLVVVQETEDSRLTHIEECAKHGTEA
jgi:ribonuclease HI